MLRILLGAILLVWATAAQAQTVQELLSECENGQRGLSIVDSIDLGSCHGFIKGVIQFYDLPLLQENIGTAICRPDTITNGQVQQIYINWSRDNPEFWTLPAVAGVLAALSEAWPCPENSSE